MWACGNGSKETVAIAELFGVGAFNVALLGKVGTANGSDFLVRVPTRFA